MSNCYFAYTDSGTLPTTEIGYSLSLLLKFCRRKASDWNLLLHAFVILLYCVPRHKCRQKSWWLWLKTKKAMLLDLHRKRCRCRILRQKSVEARQKLISIWSIYSKIQRKRYIFEILSSTVSSFITVKTFRWPRKAYYGLCLDHEYFLEFAHLNLLPTKLLLFHTNSVFCILILSKVRRSIA